MERTKFKNKIQIFSLQQKNKKHKKVTRLATQGAGGIIKQNVKLRTKFEQRKAIQPLATFVTFAFNRNLTKIEIKKK